MDNYDRARKLVMKAKSVTGGDLNAMVNALAGALMLLAVIDGEEHAAERLLDLSRRFAKLAEREKSSDKE